MLKAKLESINRVAELYKKEKEKEKERSYIPVKDHNCNTRLVRE
jgi:hypothetical protein